MGVLKLRRRATRQPQGGVKLASNSPLLKAGALAIVTGSQPVNLASGLPLKVTGPANKSITAAGIADAYNKDSYKTTETFEAIGTRSYIQFWAGFPSGQTGTSGGSGAETWVVGSTSAQTGMASRLGYDRRSIRANGSNGDESEWGAVRQWGSDPVNYSAGEVLTPGVFTVLLAARYQDRTELWRDSRLVATFLASPVDIPSQGLVFGSFVEHDAWRVANDTVLAGMVLGEWTFDQLASFTRDEKSIWQLVDAPSRILSTSNVSVADTSLSGAAAMRAAVAGSLTTQVRLAGNAVFVAAASGSLTTQVRLAGAAALQASAVGSLTTSIPLSGSASMRVTSSGMLTTAIPVAGAALMAATAAGSLAGTAAALAGNAALQVSATGALSTAIRLTGTASLTASAGGALAGTGAALAGAAAAQVSATGALSTAIRFAGAAVVQISAAGSLAGSAATLSGAASMRTSGAGALSSAIVLSGAAAVSIKAAGTLSLTAKIDVSKISPGRIVIFEGSGSRIVAFEGSGKRTRINEMSAKVPTKVGDKWMCPRDPDEESYYAADITDELADRFTSVKSSADAIEIIVHGVEKVGVHSLQVAQVDGVERTFVVVFLVGIDADPPDDWNWLARVRCANGERFDKTTWFKRTDT